MGILAAKVANCEEAHQTFVKSQAYRDIPYIVDSMMDQ